jgi:hypothetical protein
MWSFLMGWKSVLGVLFLEFSCCTHFCFVLIACVFFFCIVSSGCFRIELTNLKFLVENEHTTETLKVTLLNVTKHCVEATAVMSSEAANAADSIHALEQSLQQLDVELKKSKNDNSDVHSMLRLASLVVRQAARSLLKVSKAASSSATGDSGQFVTVELRSRLLELSNMLNNVHDKNSANLLNNYSLGTLVQRITEEISRDAAMNRVPGLSTTGLMKEIEDNFDERHRHSALVMSVLSILKHNK